jgi:hypothetical protein
MYVSAWYSACTTGTNEIFTILRRWQPCWLAHSNASKQVGEH